MTLHGYIEEKKSFKKLKNVEGCVVCFGFGSTLFLIKSIFITVGLPSTI